PRQFAQAMTAKDIFLFEVAKVAVLSSLADVDTIRYRQSVLRDCLQHESIVREIYQLAIDVIEGERKHYLSFFVRYPSGILSRAVDVLQMFIGMLKALQAIADRHGAKFATDGFSRLFAMLLQDLSD